MNRLSEFCKRKFMEYTEFDKRMGEYEAVSKVKLTKRMPVVNVLCHMIYLKYI